MIKILLSSPALFQTDLLSSQNLEGLEHLISGVLVHHSLGHEVQEGLKAHVASLVGINLCPQFVKLRVVGLERGGEGEGRRVRSSSGEIGRGLLTGSEPSL